MSWRDDLNYGLSAFGVHLPEKSLPRRPRRKDSPPTPARNTAAVVAASAAIFYAVERDHNSKVNDIYDAMIYCSTCLSVGYGDIFARTPIGKLIGTTLMTIGPALSSRAVDGTATPESIELQRQTLDSTMEAILLQLRAGTTTDDSLD